MGQIKKNHGILQTLVYYQAYYICDYSLPNIKENVFTFFWIDPLLETRVEICQKNKGSPFGRFENTQISFRD